MGGTPTSPSTKATITVTVVNHVVTGIISFSPGSYTTEPTNPVTVTGGGGTTSATFNIFTPSNNGSGGGIYSDYGAVSLSGSTVSSNNATDNGGGIFTERGSVSLQSASTVNSNTAAGVGGEGAGGGIYTYDGLVSLANSSVGQSATTGNQRHR